MLMKVLHWKKRMPFSQSISSTTFVVAPPTRSILINGRYHSHPPISALWERKQCDHQMPTTKTVHYRTDKISTFKKIVT